MIYARREGGLLEGIVEMLTDGRNAAKSPVLCALRRISSKIKDNKYTSRSRVQTIVRTSYQRPREKKYPRVKRNKA